MPRKIIFDTDPGQDDAVALLLALGSPSTKATFNNEVFYYISQKRVRPVAFMQPRLVDQRILAVYFGPNDTVDRIANYGLQNGRVFDFIARATPTGGRSSRRTASSARSTTRTRRPSRG